MKRLFRKLKNIWTSAFKIKTLLIALVIILVLDYPLDAIFGKDFIINNPALDWVATIFALYVLFGLAFHIAKRIHESKKSYLFVLALILILTPSIIFSDFMDKNFPDMDFLRSLSVLPMLLSINTLLLLPFFYLRIRGISLDPPDFSKENTAQKIKPVVKTKKKVEKRATDYVMLLKMLIAFSTVLSLIIISGFRWDYIVWYIIFYATFIYILEHMKIEVYRD